MATVTAESFALPGFMIPLPLGDVHPVLRDCVTVVIIPAVVTMIDAAALLWLYNSCLCKAGCR